MTNRITFKEGSEDVILKAVERCIEYGEFADSIVFTCGTIVTMTCIDHDPVTSFLTDETLRKHLLDDFPFHRYSENDQDTIFDETMQQNEIDFKWSQKTQFAEQCRKAYGCLMWAGYPLPGGIAADRTVITLREDAKLSVVLFPYCGRCCTLFDGTEYEGTVNQFIGQANMQGADFRRNDYMSPKPYAYVDKENKIHLLIAKEEVV
jgi:hypothetical protein